MSVDTYQRADTERTRKNSVRLSDKLVKGLEPPAKGNKITYDGALSGFGIRVTAAGRKAFILNYYIKGRERRITIGPYPALSVLAARKQAQEFLLHISTGLDPLEMRQSANKAPTMDDLFQEYDRQNLPKLAKRSAADIRSMFRKEILPTLGKKKVQDVTYSDCNAIHQRISLDRPVRANRVLEVLRRSLNLAIKWGWIENNPASGVEKNQEEPRIRSLSKIEIHRLLSALEEHPQKTSCDAITFMLLTGCRRGEALNATWEQFSDDLRVWTKPAATTKQRRLHRVPISRAAIKILSQRKQNLALSPQEQSDYVFAAISGNALTDVKRTWSSVKAKAGLRNVRLHDLRHTFASLLVSQGQSLPTIGAMLGHTQPQTTARYAHLFDDPLAAAADLVGNSIFSERQHGTS